MGRGKCAFRQRDVTRLVKAIKAAGEQVGRVEVDNDGRIAIIARKPSDATKASELNPWDTVLAGETKQKRAA